MAGVLDGSDPRRMLQSAIAAAFYGRFRELRPAQLAAIEPLLNGRNVVIASGTGSGKTEAAAAPLLSRYYRAAVDSDSLTILYIAPTRALVNDLLRRLSPPLESVGLRVGVRHGERDDLKSVRPPHLLITTPESLDVMTIRVDSALDTVQAVIVDEVHLLQNTQRGLQLSVLLRRLQARLGRDLHWVALSATVGDLQQTVEFLFGAAAKADLLVFATDRPIDALVRHPADLAAFARLIGRAVDDRRTKVLLFADSRRECERLAESLSDGPGVPVPVFAHYSSLSREVREKTESDFAAQPGAVCVATSTLELGIDIGDIDLIALWGAPASAESFLQRIGRGNRRSHKSNVLCLVPDTCAHPLREVLVFLALLDAARQGQLPQRSAYKLFGAFAQQSMSKILENRGAFTRLADLADPIAPCGYCDRHQVEAILDELASQEFVQRHGFQRRYGAAQRLWDLVDLRMIYGNFPVAASTVEMRHGARVLGEVPIDNLLRFHTGDTVRFAGRAWRVNALKTDHVSLEPAGSTRATTEIRYGGRGLGLDLFVAQRIWDMLSSERLDREALDTESSARVGGLAARVARWSERSEIPYVVAPEGLTYLTFAGRLVNRVVAYETGQEVAAAGDLGFVASKAVDFSGLNSEPAAHSAAVDAVFEGTGDRSFYQGLLPGDLQMEEFRQPWLGDRMITGVLERLRSSRGVEVTSWDPTLV